MCVPSCRVAAEEAAESRETSVVVVSLVGLLRGMKPDDMTMSRRHDDEQPPTHHDLHSSMDQEAKTRRRAEVLDSEK